MILSEDAEETHENPQSTYVVTQKEFESNTSLIQN
jgi:hypothetical protein